MPKYAFLEKLGRVEVASKVSCLCKLLTVADQNCTSVSRECSSKHAQSCCQQCCSSQHVGFLFIMTPHSVTVFRYLETHTLSIVIQIPLILPSWQSTKSLLQGSDQFMNWIGIDNQFNSIQHELNWNWIERFWIGIELELKAWTDRNWSIQSIHFQFNSSSYEVKHFFVCHMEIVVWQAIPCKQAYPHAPLCSQYGVCRGLLT